MYITVNWSLTNEINKVEELFMRVTICIGSACHLKGSREIIQQLQTLVTENGLTEKVDLNGSFCSGNCVNGVCVTIDDKLFSLKPEDTKEFFDKEIHLFLPSGRLGKVLPPHTFT